MRRTGLLLTGLLWGAVTFAADDPGPILIQFADDIGASSGRAEVWTPDNALYGLVGTWANASINKKSRVMVAAFRQNLAGFDLAAETAKLLACTAVADPAAGCREARDAGKGITDALAAAPAHRGTFVVVTPEWQPEQLLIRATAAEIEYGDGKLIPRRNYTAVFATRVPADVLKAAKKSKGGLEAWWLEGTPTRLETETRAGFTEISALLTTLAAEVGPANQFPARWTELPGVENLTDQKLVNCQGMGCKKGHRLVKQSADRYWFTFVNGFMPLAIPTDKGTVLASFDHATAENALNLWVQTQLGNSGY